MLRYRNNMDVRLHRLRLGFFERGLDPGRRTRWPGDGAGRRPRLALPRGRPGWLGYGGWFLRRRLGGRGPGRSGPGLGRSGEPRGLRLSDLWRLRAGGFGGLVGRPWVSLVGWFGGVFGFPVGPVLDRCRDLGDRLQDRQEELLDRISCLLGGSAPEKPPGQPPPEALAEQADQCGEGGERGGTRHGGYVSQRAGLVKLK